MFGYFIGTVCLMGLFALLRRGRYRYGYGYHGGHRGFRGEGPYCGGGGYDGGYGGDDDPYGRLTLFSSRWAGSRWGRGVFLRPLFARLETTRGRRRSCSKLLAISRRPDRSCEGDGRSRAEVAQAVRAPSLDEEILGLLFARHDEALRAIRKRRWGRWPRCNDALDERQRTLLADFVARGPGWGSSVSPVASDRGSSTFEDFLQKGEQATWHVDF